MMSADLEPHHEGAAGTLLAVEKPRPFEAHIHVIQVQVLPLCLARSDQLPQLADLSANATFTSKTDNHQVRRTRRGEGLPGLMNASMDLTFLSVNGLAKLCCALRLCL